MTVLLGFWRPVLPDRNWYLYVAELSREALSEEVEERNPERDPDKPLVKVGYIGKELPRDRFPNGDFSKANAPVLKRHGLRLLPLLGGANEYASGSWREEGVLAERQEKVAELRSEGYTVYNRPPRERYRLYVIELSPEVLEEKRPNSRYTHESGDGGYRREPVYVGVTGKGRGERFDQHRRGDKTHIGDFAVQLRNDLTRPKSDLTKLEALQHERSLAWSLGNRGHPVYGGH